MAATLSGCTGLFRPSRAKERRASTMRAIRCAVASISPAALPTFAASRPFPRQHAQPLRPQHEGRDGIVFFRPSGCAAVTPCSPAPETARWRHRSAGVTSFQD